MKHPLLHNSVNGLLLVATTPLRSPSFVWTFDSVGCKWSR